MSNCNTGCVVESNCQELPRAFNKNDIVTVKTLNSAGYQVSTRYVSLVNNNTDYPPRGAGLQSPTWRLENATQGTGQVVAEPPRAPDVSAVATDCGYTITVGAISFEHAPNRYITRTADILKVYNHQMNTLTDIAAIMAPTVVDTVILTRADFPGLPDCHNAVRLNVNLSLRVDPKAADATTRSIIAHSEIQGATLYSEGGTVGGNRANSTDGYKSSVVIPFNATGELVVKHIVDSYPAAAAVDFAQSHMAVKYLGSEFVSY